MFILSKERNVCPCGSGKKYKRCCATVSNAAVVDLAWQTIRQTEGCVVDQHLMPYVMKTLPPKILKSAIEDLFPELPEKRGDIVFSRFLSLDEQSIFIGMAPILIPVNFQTDLIDFREWLIEENEGNPLSSEALRTELDWDLLDYFFKTMEYLNNPQPRLMNTDGYLIVKDFISKNCVSDINQVWLH